MVKAADSVERVKRDKQLIAMAKKSQANERRIVLSGQVKRGLVDLVDSALQEVTPTELINLALAHYLGVPLDTLAKE